MAPGRASRCLSLCNSLARSSSVAQSRISATQGHLRGLLTVVWSCPSNCTQVTLLDRVPPLPQLLEQALHEPTCHTFCTQGAVTAVRLVTAEEQLVAVVAVPALVRQVPADSSIKLWPLLLRLPGSPVQYGTVWPTSDQTGACTRQQRSMLDIHAEAHMRGRSCCAGHGGAGLTTQEIFVFRWPLSGCWPHHSKAWCRLHKPHLEAAAP